MNRWIVLLLAGILGASPCAAQERAPHIRVDVLTNDTSVIYVVGDKSLSAEFIVQAITKVRAIQSESRVDLYVGGGVPIRFVTDLLLVLRKAKVDSNVRVLIRSGSVDVAIEDVKVTDRPSDIEIDELKEK